MLAAEHYSELFADWASKNDLSEIHRSKISLHHAKAGYSYPTIRLPHTLSRLAGSSTHIYQKVHDGALAFLVVVSPSGSASENAAESSKTSVFTRRRSSVRIRPSPSFILQSGARIKPEAEDCEYEELHNYDEKLCNFRAEDTDESLVGIMTDRYVDEGGNEQLEMLWDELIPGEGAEYDKNDPYFLKAESEQSEAIRRQRETEAIQKANAPKDQV